PRQPACRGERCERVHDGAPDAEPADAGEHGDAADLAAMRNVETSGARRRAVDERENVQALAVAVVELEVRGNALLVDENRIADTADRVVIGLEIRFSDLDRGHRSLRDPVPSVARRADP